MKLYSPLAVFLRVIVYGGLLFGIAQGIFFDAAHPIEAGYFGELTFTEITQELFLFCLFVFFAWMSFRWQEMKVMAQLTSLFFLMAFIREFNFLIEGWVYPVAIVFAFFIGLVVRNFRKLQESVVSFFRQPAAHWLLAGGLVTLVFSRLMGRSKFWRLLYHDESYRLAKAAVEEGLELLGDTLMLIAAFEFLLVFLVSRRSKQNSEN